MRISDWSSDVCSSDLPGRQPGLQSALKVHFLVPARSSPEWLPRISAQVQRGAGALFGPLFPQALQLGEETCGIGALLAGFKRAEQIGRASVRERVCPAVEFRVVAVSLK